MKKWLILSIGLCLLFVHQTALAQGVGTSFYYQGRLNDGGGPANGSYDFIFELFDSAEGAGELGAMGVPNQNVADGYFTAVLDFGSGIFNGNERWLHIEVRPGDSTGDYTILTPRQAIKPTPYALYALNATGGSGFWDASGNNIYNTNTGNVGIGTPNPLSKLSFGTTWNPKMLSLWDGVDDFYGFGTDIGRMTFYAMNSEVMTLNSLGWLGLGTPAPVGYFDITGAADTMTLARFNQTGNLNYNGLRLDRDGTEKWFVGMNHVSNKLVFRRNAATNDLVINDTNGYVGIGTYSPTQLLHVYGTVNPRMLVESPSNATPELNLKRGPEAWGMFIGSDAGLHFFHNGTKASITHGGNFGIGTSSPTQKLEIGDGNIYVKGPGNFDSTGEQATVYLGTGHHYIRSEHGFGVKIGTYAVGDALAIKEVSGNVGIGTTSPASKLEVRGNIRVSNSAGNPVVELGEGLDYAEGFNVAGEQNVQPGALLIIDPDHPGQLKLSTKAYDRKVAGIVAGAQGLGSGVRLGNGEFDHDVALAGRVYCNVDTTYGAIAP
ncbi:MAG: hypothetical protein GY869_13775, partial [Planctomycetes bacterium]|nr:hypothetical protein [Planctomycetota bacterium]